MPNFIEIGWEIREKLRDTSELERKIRKYNKKKRKNRTKTERSSDVVGRPLNIGTSIKVGCATHSLYASSGPKAEGVPTNNQREQGSGPCRLWGGLDKARHIVQTALLVRVQRSRNDLYNAVKRPSTRPSVLSMIFGSYFRRRRRFTILLPDEMKFDSLLTLLSL